MTNADEEYGVQPPQDLAAEQCVLGGMLLSDKAITDAAAILTADDFYRPNHATIFDAIVTLVGAGEPVDPVTVGDKLRHTGLIEKVGGAPYLLTLYQSPPNAANAGYYAKIVAGKARLRRLGLLGQRLQQLAYDPTTADEDIAAAVGQGEKMFRDQHRPSGKALDFDELVAAWRADQDTPVHAIKTPWPQLNEWLNGGVRKGQLIVVAGRPGEGKSNLGLNMVTYGAEWGYSSLAFSVEMPKLEVTARVLAAGAQVKMSQLIRREMDLETSQAVEEYIATNKGMMFEVVDEERITVEQIVAHCRTKQLLDMVFVDYAQLLSATDPRLDRRLQVAHISRSLKIAARELDVAMIVATQLNRGPVKDGKSRTPLISDIGESGAVEQDADIVLLLNRDDNDPNVVQVIVGKNRNGRRGAIEMQFKGAQARVAQ